MKSSKLTYPLLIAILFLASFLLATFDSGLFVYPSLSRSLLMECSLTIFCITNIVTLIINKEVISLKSQQVFLICWVGYILVHSIFLVSAEMYRTTYLGITLVSILLLSNDILAQNLKKNIIADTIIIVGIIHIVFMAAQYLGVMKSDNEFFSITGANDNPNVTAVYLVGCLPFLVKKIAQKERIMLSLFLTVSFLVAIIVLKCRTAYIGIVMEILTLIFLHKPLYGKIKSFWYSYKYIFLMVIVGGGILVATKLYTMKQSSAEGRIFIWHRTCNMITNNYEGYGYGLYEKNYNLFQAEYFKSCDTTIEERTNASFVPMAYNDFMEQSVEGGLVGGFFLLLFYIVGIRKGTQNRMLCETSILVSFAVMSLTNFIYASIQPWLLVCCCWALVVSKDNPPKTDANKFVNSLFYVMVLISVIYNTINVVGKTWAQINLNKIKEQLSNGLIVEDDVFLEIEKNADTSECFWRTRAENMFRKNDYNSAIMCYEKALEYSSAPSLFMGLHYSALKNSDKERSKKALVTINNMIPSRLLPKYELMKSYVLDNDTSKVIMYADDILCTVEKRNTETGDRIKFEAEKIKQKYTKK